MKRRLLNLLTLLSLLLCVAVVAVWVRSHWSADVLHFAGDRWYRAVSGGGGVHLSSVRLLHRRGDARSGAVRSGKLVVYAETQQPYRSTWRGRDGSGTLAPRWQWVTVPYSGPKIVSVHAWVPPGGAWPGATPLWTRARASLDPDTYLFNEVWFDGGTFWVPYWLPAVLSALLPAVWVSRVALRSRIKPHQCKACGYDLRATPDRCPECGTARD